MQHQSAPTDKSTVPAYVQLYNSGELQRRADHAIDNLDHCKVCPRECNTNRHETDGQLCKVGRHARISNYFAHLGEESCLTGWRGSGTLFFNRCNLQCVFCQNANISQTNAGKEVNAQQLADIMLELQGMGCHNINWVTPGHIVPQLLEAMPIAIEQGLRLPIVYNSNGYDHLDSLKLLEGVVDIYMPDFKYWDEHESAKYLKAYDYGSVAQQALLEMQRQVGDLVLDENGLAQRGLLVRHLVMPNGLDQTEKIMKFLVREVSPNVYLNLLSQYHPAHKVENDEKYAPINRRLGVSEYEKALELAVEAGVTRLDQPLSRLRAHW